jgi:hypothetical protein
MFRTLGNITKNPNVALLFIAISADPKRLRINGQAAIFREPERLSKHTGAQAVIEVVCLNLFPNCPRYRYGRRTPIDLQSARRRHRSGAGLENLSRNRTFAAGWQSLARGVNATQKRDETLS